MSIIKAYPLTARPHGNGQETAFPGMVRATLGAVDSSVTPGLSLMTRARRRKDG